MFLIDTNVISESRKVRSGRAAPEVIAWLKATDPSTTFISAMSCSNWNWASYELSAAIPYRAKAEALARPYR
jgi:predicted nucleic acid-binding protein